MDKEKIIRAFASVWPTIKKTLDEIFYFILNLIRRIVKIAIGQITGK